MPTFTERLQHAWNAFLNKDPPNNAIHTIGYGSSFRPDRGVLTRGNQRSIVSSVYTRIAIDCAAIPIEHVRLDQDGRYVSTIDSGLNNCLTVSANIDQTGRAFVQDFVMSLLDEGVAALVPIDTDANIRNHNTFDILSMRVGKVTDWYPQHVRINVYNQQTGQREDILLPKKSVAIVENPLYSVMNEPNSTLQRLIRKLNLLDAVDEQSSAGKLDLIIQLPYIVKTEARKQQAQQRRKQIQEQLAGSKYGIAYTDGTEKVTQINRPVENNLMSQIQYLTNTLYNQLGITQQVFAGTADQRSMQNYYNRTIEPILSAIADEIKRKFLTKTARTQHQSIMFHRSPFKLVSISQIAEIADKFTRNEILSSNEVRQLIGYKPSTDPKADKLQNKNMPQPQQDLDGDGIPDIPADQNQNGSLPQEGNEPMDYAQNSSEQSSQDDTGQYDYDQIEKDPTKTPVKFIGG